MNRRSIEALFDQHGRDLPMRSDDALRRLTIEATYGERPVLAGPPKLIAFAMDVRDNALVPDCYSDEASTWA